MSIPALSVRRPIASLMIIVAMLILGGVALTRMPVALLPDLNFPAAVVITNYENVGPQEVEALVTRPIEEAMATVRNVRRVTSTSSPGSSTVVVQFNWGTDMDFAALEMRERLDLIRDFLPDGVSQPQVFRFDPSLQAMFQFNVGGMEDLASLRQFVDDRIKNRLERIEGVAQVNVMGGMEREIRVEIDQSRLDAWGLSVETVRQALAAGNLTLPVGRVTAQGRELNVRTVGEFTDLDQIRNTVVYAGPAGVVRVGDVARVVDGYSEELMTSRLNGQPSVAVTIQREAQANTVVVSDRILEELERLRAELPELTFQVVWDEAEFIRQSIQAVVDNALQGALIAMAVLYFFLRSLGPTLIIGSSIPVAGLATLFFLYLMDVSLNMLSLGGLALGVGMLVDNAIVSLENIFRHRQMGKPPEQAAIEGADEVGLALGASTLTTVAVFLPIVFVGGIAAELFTDLSLAVAISLLMSLLVAVTFVPMMAARVRMRIPEGIDGDEDGEATAAAGPMGQGAGGSAGGGVRRGSGGKVVRKSAFDRARDGYARLLRWLLGHRWVAVAVITVFLASGFVLAPRLGQEFLPVTDTGEISVRVRMPYGTVREQTDAVVRRIEEFVSTLPDVDTVFSSVGSRDGSGNETGVMLVSLVERSQRHRSTEEIVELIRQFGAGFPEAEVSVAMQNPYTGGGEGGGAPIVLRLRGENLDQLKEIAEAVAARVASIPGTREVEVSTREGRPELQVVVDRERAARYGLTVAQIASSLRTAVDGAVATRYRPDAGGTEIDVRVQLAREWRENLGSLERLLIPTPLGFNVPLYDVARLVPGTAPVSIDREDQARVVRVYAHLLDRDLGSVVADIIRELEAMDLPSDVEWAFGGDTMEMEEAFGSLGFALILAVVLIYMIMAAQFESLMHPLVIMFTVPLGFIGVVWGLVLTGTPLSVPALIGIILLAGIAVNNGIVMIDYINQLRRRGMDRLTALVTGCPTRLRPVAMTTLTTVLGMIPLALGQGEGSELQAPIAIVVISGLSVSTLLTLGFVPVAYSLADDLGQWLARVLAGLRRGGSAKAPAGAGTPGEIPPPRRDEAADPVR